MKAAFCIAVCTTLRYNTPERWYKIMANKNATVSCRIEEDVKVQAEEILDRLGLPVSIVIGSLYRQIIDKGGIPFSLTIRQENDNFGYTDEELNAKLEHSYQQVLRREGTPIKEVFDRLERKYVNA